MLKQPPHKTKERKVTGNMKFCLRIIVLLFLVTGTSAQEFDLSDALDDIAPTPAKPKEQPKAPGNNDGRTRLLEETTGFDLGDAFDDIAPTPAKPKEQPKPPKKNGDFELDLTDALNPDPNPKPDKPAVNPPKSGGGGGSFTDSDLFDVSDGNYNPDGGRSGGGRAVNPDHDPQGGADQPQEAGSGAIAGIVSSIGVALLGAASSYFAYQKKKLCFKIQGGTDPESGNHQVQSDPQVFSNLLKTS